MILFFKSPLKITEILKKKRRFLSIDFGQVFVRAVYIESLGPRFTLLNYDFKKIPSIVENRGELVNFINNFITKNSILGKELCLTISDSDSIVVKHLILPLIPKNEIPEAIRWQLKGDPSLDSENTILDWQIVKEYTDEEGAKKNGMMCILVKSEVIDKYLSVARDCKLMPVRISSCHFNYIDILRYIQGNPPLVAILDIGYKETTLCIYNNNRLNFIRSLAFSFEKLTQSLIETLTEDKGKILLSYEKAEEITNALGIPKDENLILQDNIQAIQVISAIRSLLEGLVKELKRSFDYFSSNLKEKQPSALYLSGGGANLKNLDWYLNKELNINVSKLPLPNCVNVQALDNEKLSEDQNLIMSAVGAALSGPGEINLLPQEIRTQKAELIEKVSLRIVAIVLGAIFLFSFLIFKLQVRDYKKRLTNAQIHLQIIQEIKSLKEKIDSRDSLVNEIQKNTVPADGLLKVIAAKLPNNIILDGLLLEQKEHKLILRGVILENENIVESVLANFIEKLEGSSFFTDVTLVFSKKRDRGQEFEIGCDLAH